jgi:hypothetical protein
MAARDGKRTKLGWIGAIALVPLMSILGSGAQAQALPGSGGIQADRTLGEGGVVAAATTGTGLPAGTCVPTSTVLCLGGGRFRVSVTWRQSGGATGVGSLVAGSTADSGLFWFFSPTNYEMMVKVLNGCAVNNRHWVFFLATTNVGFTLTVTDTMTQQVKTYQNAPGSVSPVVTDTSAFATCP